VIVLSLEHGLHVGIAAALAACGIYIWEGLPPAALGEDFYEHVARIAAEPIGWTCAALLIGQVRHRQIGELATLKEALADRERHCQSVAAYCDELRTRTEMLERHIAANAVSSHVDVAEAVAALNQANSSDFTERLTKFIMLMTGSAEYALYILRGDALKLAIQPRDENMSAADMLISCDDPLYEAVVDHRKLLCATTPADRDVLEERAVLAGPLLEDTAANHVIGMLRVGGADLTDFPDDVERRFALVCKEIARLLSRTILIENSHQPPPAVLRPLSRLEQAHMFAQRQTSLRKTNPGAN
jgi:hypothetical protein